ncbi:MAG: alpha-amylase [Gemmataceae bacterium]
MSTVNGVMMQYFHWYTPADGTLWKDVAARARELAEAGITALWLPPAYKSNDGATGVGYAVYDMYDLGEFDQKGSVRTRYGTRQEYLAATKALHEAGLQVYADIVFNHRIGCDEFEPVRATPFPSDDRLHASGPQRDILAPTKFTFPGRKGKYSPFVWTAAHFSAVDYDKHQPDEKNTVYLLAGKQFDSNVALENGNFDFLMGADVDIDHPEVVGELYRWSQWYIDTVGLEGFRLDAVKHISAPFWPGWLRAMSRHAGRELFCVAEYWSTDLQALHWFLDTVGPTISVFDVPLHYNFHAASRAGGQYDMRRLLDGTLMKQRGMQAVTFVSNHDAQPLQALESVVEPWFKPLAYATILLRQEGYPCVFYPDYYGAEYEDYGRDGNKHRVVMPSHRFLIDVFLKARREYGHGPQVDYLDHFNRIGWVRLGDAEHPRAMAVLMSDGPEGTKWMDVGRPGTVFRDLTGHIAEPITTNQEGWGEFRCQGGSVSVWVQE